MQVAQKILIIQLKICIVTKKGDKNLKGSSWKLKKLIKLPTMFT